MPRGRRTAGSGLSVAVVTRDEEERLPGCLESVPFADEIVVVDSGSTDATVEIAGAMGARVLEEPWRGFSEQKQFAVDRCSNEWVLILDADERVPESTASEILEALSARDDAVTAFSFPRKNIFHGRWIRHCGWWPDRIVRLVDRREGAFDGRAVHERWLTRGREHPLDAPLEHYSFRRYSDLTVKMERYSDLAAECMHAGGRTAGPLTPPLHGLWMFFRTWVLELGILDGFDGFVISLMNGGGSFFKYAKLRELARDPGRVEPGGKE
ncbi:MAG: glycosyltransferase family 2 protein [Deltaproteobacteria bacterium]|nr:glycosyltransferase family 2 protein [Deltaproteobacteria bacterium]